MSIPVVSPLTPEKTGGEPGGASLFSELPKKEPLQTPTSPVDDLGLLADLPETGSKQPDKVDVFPDLTSNDAPSDAPPNAMPALGNLGLTPIDDSSGLTPIDEPRDDLLSELTDGDSLSLQALESSANPLGTPVANPLGAPAANPFAGQMASSSNPYASPQTQYASPYQQLTRLAPHRGGTILTMGIVGFMICLPLGIAAWSMGRNDLNEMNSNRMDPSGRGMTMTGMIFGMISAGLMALNLIVIIGVLALAALAS